MRITGGELKNIRIQVPQGIRPTQDNVRLAIFNILGEKIRGARFVDLFAGSGVIGIEALSRGAEKVFFVDHSQKVIRILKENIRNTGYYDKAEVLVKDACNVVVNEFDILFADPPYNKNYLSKIIQNYKTCGGILILEHSKHEEIDIPPSTGQVVRDYKFGDTVITFLSGDSQL